MDALAQMMNQGNVRAGARLLVVDDCSGLLVAACLERLGGVRLARKRRWGHRRLTHWNSLGGGRIGAGQIIGFQSLPDPSTFYAATLLNLDHAHMQPLHIFSWKRMREDWEQTHTGPAGRSSHATRNSMLTCGRPIADRSSSPAGRAGSFARGRRVGTAETAGPADQEGGRQRCLDAVAARRPV